MLDIATKRRIDSARDILVGKVPDPKSQVEQITIALIYKFMDDMDSESEEEGGERTFFKGDFEKYAWHKIFDSQNGGFEMISLYAEAIEKMDINPNVPQLFRDIFKNAYLPYRDPETLRSFLKEINKFEYEHSERLGDAFEYLLSVMSSQGDAGQFRTPRHIIDFMVDVLDPQKKDSILDPACGTGGFLISSYKHILKNNSSNYDPATEQKLYANQHASATETVVNGKMYRGDKLEPDERIRMANNIIGYDISPDMVRLSLVNMYLHGVTEPHISEYDTLTSEDKWNEYVDVILANPPFMSPKGGIKPHGRFSIQSKRSEVLFVDYMADHLTPNGRTMVIVPEGIIFQTGIAYKSLRRKLVEENYLVGVISLPAGVFNPYSGVKTSILWFDRTLAKKTDKVLFLKVENDGFDLGAQRRPIKLNDLPKIALIIKDYKQSLIDQKEFSLEENQGLMVKKAKLAEDGCYILTGEKYAIDKFVQTKFDLVELKDNQLFQIEAGGTPNSKNEEYWNGEINWATLVDLPADDFVSRINSTVRKITTEGLKNSSAKLIPANSILISTRATIGRIGINNVDCCTNQGFKNIIIKNHERVNYKYVAFVMTGLVQEMNAMATGGTFKELSKSNFSTLKIPLPPSLIQEEIVAEIEVYLKIIDGARQVVGNYKPTITIDPEWEMVKLGDICENLDGKRVPITKSDRKNGEYPYYGASGVVDYVADYLFDEELLLVSEDGANLIARSTPIAFSVKGKVWVNNHAHVLRFKNAATQYFVELYLNSIPLNHYITGSAQPKLNQRSLNSITIPLPDPETQENIMRKIRKEYELVSANSQLIKLFGQKIKVRIDSVWGK